jgi:membrane associated rhomboid family serine protease
LRRDQTLERVVYWLFEDRIPLTKILIVTNAVSFFIIAGFNLVALAVWTIFFSASLTQMPWTLLTYPFVSVDSPLSVLFGCYWLWVAGGSLERSWGTKTFAIFFLIVSALSALGLFAGSALTGVVVSANGLWLPLAGVTIAFAMRNPEEQILFMFVIPMKLKYLALLTVPLVVIGFSQGSPLIGVLALTGCAFSYWYVRSGAYISSLGQSYRPRQYLADDHNPHRRKRSLNPINWLRRYRERRKLKDLFRRSGMDDG